MSKNSRKLRRAFEIQLNEPRFRNLPGRARDRAVEAATRRLERKVSAETERALEKAEEEKYRILQAKEEAAEAKRLRSAEAERQRKERAEQRQACTCRKPTLDRRGKCTRCHKTPASTTRRR